MSGSGHLFGLRPFPDPLAPSPAVAINGQVEKSGRILRLSYQLSGDLAGLSLAAPAAEPQRQNQLWRESCLEFFLAPAREERYWEGNFSPAGHWNLYRFQSYREGMEEEERIAAIPVNWAAAPEGVTLRLELDLSPLLAPAQPLRLGISAILRATTGATSYWALSHPLPRPDFHHRAGFQLFIP